MKCGCYTVVLRCYLLPPADYRYATCILYVDAIQAECMIFNRKVREVTSHDADYRYATCIQYVDSIQMEQSILNGRV